MLDTAADANVHAHGQVGCDARCGRRAADAQRTQRAAADAVCGVGAEARAMAPSVVLAPSLQLGFAEELD